MVMTVNSVARLHRLCTGCFGQGRSAVTHPPPFVILDLWSFTTLEHEAFDLESEDRW